MNKANSSEKTIEPWMNSKDHRDTILYSDYTDIGVGYYNENEGIFWMQMFIGN